MSRQSGCYLLDALPQSHVIVCLSKSYLSLALDKRYLVVSGMTVGLVFVDKPDRAFLVD